MFARKWLVVSGGVLLVGLMLLLMLPRISTAQEPALVVPDEALQLRGQPVVLDDNVPLPAALRYRDPNEMVTVYVVLEGPSAAEVAVNSGYSLQSGTVQQRVQRRLAEIEAQQAALRPLLAQLGAQEMYSFKKLANAIQVRVPAGKLADVMNLPGVVRVDPVGRYRLLNTSSVPYVGAPQVWDPNAAGTTGENISIGIIDTGIDYTHAMFGGSGVITDYQDNIPDIITSTPGLSETFPTAKVVGGYDFAGDNYDAGGRSGSVTPNPDPDPLDCNGHGTHVAGTAAGFGVLNNGATYTGPYTASLDMSQFLIGPGVAPEADLYALKVFGCAGSTELVTQAYEWAVDPNNDGDFSDRLDVLNLSLGCNFSCGSETELQMTNLLAQLGTFMAIAAGNDGNTFYATGDPSSAKWALSVAAGIDSGIENLAISVTAPISIAGVYEAVEAAFSKPLEDVGPITATVVYAEPNDACGPLTNASAISGTIALIDRGTCFFTTKFVNAQAAGAVAVIVVNYVDGPPIAMGGTPTTTINIPGVMISKDDGITITGELSRGVTVVLSADIKISRADLAHQVADFSSRGPGSPDNRLKPEISAPGFQINSAAVGQGTKGIDFVGTSMAAPHVAGAAALLKEVRPNFSVEELKAALMNTAGENRDANQVLYPESRVGAGRMQVDKAAQTEVLVMAADDPGAVGLSFGAIFTNERVTKTRAVRIVNKGATPVTYTITVSETVTETGVMVMPVLTQVVVPANGERTVPVQLVADPTSFDRTADPTTPATQLGFPRYTLFEASGQLRFNGTPALHLPYYANVYPGSAMYAQDHVLTLPSGMGEITATIAITGTSVHPQPLVSAFELGAFSPDEGYTSPLMRMADLVAVGAASNVPSTGVVTGTIFFGLATADNWTTPQPLLVEFDIYIDTDEDGRADYVVFNWNLGAAFGSDDTDTFVTVVYDVANGTLTVDSFAYGVSPSVDTAPYNNNVFMMAVGASSIGLSESNPDFNYQVVTWAGGSPADVTSWISYNGVNPIVKTTPDLVNAAPLYVDGGSITVSVDRTRMADAGYSAENPPTVLLLHHMNTNTNSNPRVETVALKFNTYSFFRFLPLVAR
ncbi:MAG: S8 family serine peptidase [Ardenticatenia bacterium]|nr:S8 family serine peptidase [Ardenticatenia bacterium]